jgi:hypothetical protein
MNIQRNHQLLVTLGVAPLRECVYVGGRVGVYGGGGVMNVLCVCVCMCVCI